MSWVGGWDFVSDEGGAGGQGGLGRVTARI